LVGDNFVNWLSHAYGAINLLLAAGPNILKADDFAASLFYATHIQGVRHSVW
jgi:hypothetical protein